MGSSLSVGYLIGAFDMFNIAHLSVLEQVRDACDVVVVGLLGDDEVRLETGMDPITGEHDRGELLRHVRGVDDVVHHDPQWVREHPQARVYAFTERADVRTDVVVVPDRVPANSLLWGGAGGAVEAAGGDVNEQTAPDENGAVVTGYVPGAWDMFHIGHLNILLRARAECDRLIVGAVTDAALVAAKGKQPMVPLAERMQILASLGLVDEVVIDQGSKLDVWHRHRFDVLFKGDDWLRHPQGDQLVADMATVGVRVHFFPYTQSTSSTRLRGIVTTRPIEPKPLAGRLNGGAHPVEPPVEHQFPRDPG